MQTIRVLVCSADGTKRLEQRQVEDDYLVITEPDPGPGLEEQITDLQQALCELYEAWGGES